MRVESTFEINGHCFMWFPFGDGIELELCTQCHRQRSKENEGVSCVTKTIRKKSKTKSKKAKSNLQTPKGKVEVSIKFP